MVEAAKRLSTRLAFLPCARRGFEAVFNAASPDPTSLWGATLGLQTILAVAGDSRGVDTVLQSAIARGLPVARSLYIIDGLANLPLGARPAEEIAAVGQDFEGLPRLALWALGLWFARERDAASLGAVLGEASALAARGGDPRDSLLVRNLEARRALLSGDSAAALRQLQALSPQDTRTEIQWDLFAPLTAERLETVRLLLAAGRLREALEATRALDHLQPLANLLYQHQAAELRLEVAKRLGDDGEVRAARARLEALGATVRKVSDS
jgi:hypothetical protein